MAVYDNREISMPSNPAQTLPQMDVAKNVGSAPLPTNIVNVPSFMNPNPVGTTVKINFGPYQDQIAVVTKMLRNSRRSHQRYKAKLCLQSNGQTVVIGRNHLEAVPTPINPGAPLPGNPAYPVPQSSGAQDIPGLNPIDNVPDNSGRTGVRMPMPDLLDSHAAKRDSVQSQSSSSEIVPEDEDTFRQYLRSLNQSSDHQSVGQSQRPRQGSSGGRGYSKWEGWM